MTLLPGGLGGCAFRHLRCVDRLTPQLGIFGRHRDGMTEILTDSYTPPRQCTTGSTTSILGGSVLGTSIT